uniref:Uncharacterized protein n=1 Tax=Anopheles epiroticus TaxID=199890 RepID=A0A182PWW8_9DIPT
MQEEIEERRLTVASVSADRFMSMVHEMADLSEVMKLQYLLASLKGDALAQFDHVQLSSGNYDTTWKALLDRYDDSKILRREYFKALYRLEPMNEATAKELIRQIEEDTGNMDDMFYTNDTA